jgi:phospholipid/cholesterol/gamma-HCH transport system substrate-binding protein
MDATRAEKTRLGLFLIFTGAVLVISIVFLIGSRLAVKTDDYFTRISESVTGLSAGSTVKQNGVDIGEITTITTDSGDVQKSVIHFKVARGTAMKTDMTATLGSYGITGLKYLEITGGNYGSPDVPPGGEVRSGLSMLGRLALRADSIATKVDRLLTNFIAITGGRNQENLDRLIGSSASLAVSMDSLTREIQDVKPGHRLKRILEDAEATAADAREKVRRTDVAGTMEEYKRTAIQVAKTAQTLDVTVRNTQEDLTVVLSHLKETMKNMNTFSREIKENPAVLLRGEHKQERLP